MKDREDPRARESTTISAFLIRTYRAPSRLEEALTAELWERGTVGLELRETRPGELEIDAYFPVEAPPAPLAPGSWGDVQLVQERLIRPRDWLAEYRRCATAFAVGRRLWIDPGEGNGDLASVPAGRHLLRIPARTAFGTGSHATTRLVLELLEELEIEGRRVLDVGFGSGILGFAALLFGAAEVVGVEIDLQAALQAPQYGRLNGLRPGLVAGGLGALRPGCRFDLVLANILPQHILGEVASIGNRLRTGGVLVYSGFLRRSRSQVMAVWQRQGLEVMQQREAGEWGALALLRPPA